MNFSVLAPEVNSALLMAGPGAAPMLEVAAAWDGIGSELTSAAGIFSSVTSDLTVAAWQGPAAMSMTDTAAPYSSWLATAAAEAAESATQARAAAAAYGDALAAIAHPRLVAANRSQLVSLVRSNLFGQNAPAIAAAEAAYEQMWAQDVTAMAGYHSSTSAAVAQPATGLPAKRASRLGWIVVADGWANVLFYFAANLTKNRALSFGRNKHGEANIWSTIGLAPAYLFGVLVTYALPVIGWKALHNGRSGEPLRD
jgi:hypothetical protein